MGGRMIFKEALEILYKGIAPNPTANNECMDLCKKAIEKQIPKKPKDILLTTYKFSWVCPNCETKHTNEWCGTERKLPFCSICGQALDWENEK